jgi:CheY-like chemotaxis protein
MMPGIDGIETVRIIREEIGTDYARNIPIIALTANAITGNEELFLSSGFNAFLTKPVDAMKLDAILHSWVRDKNIEKEYVAIESNRNDCGSLLEGMEIAGLDIKKGLKYFSDNEETFIGVLRTFAATTAPMIDSLNVRLTTGDLEEYADIVHGIKGSSNGIFAYKAGSAAKELEIAAKGRELEAVIAGHGPFAELMKTLIDNINTMLSEIDTIADKPLKDVPDPVLLQELREACELFDMDKVDNIMAQLESFKYENGGKMVAWLREQINNMTFENIYSEEWPSELF